MCVLEKIEIQDCSVGCLVGSRDKIRINRESEREKDEFENEVVGSLLHQMVPFLISKKKNYLQKEGDCFFSFEPVFFAFFERSENIFFFQKTFFSESVFSSKLFNA